MVQITKTKTVDGYALPMGSDGEPEEGISEKAASAQAMARDYVLVTNRHEEATLGGNVLLTWGRRTQDAEQRCFGGYTINLSRCERYTLRELRDHGEVIAGMDFPFCAWRDQADFGVRVVDLPELGARVMEVAVL